MILICLLCIYPEICLAQQRGEALEYEAKVALIYNFAKFTTWPEETFQDAETPFVFAVLGKSPFGDALKVLDGKKIGGRRIQICHFPAVSDFESCQVLFCTPDDLMRFSEANHGLLNRQHVLTVGDKEGFTEANGILFVTFVEDHLGFKVNLRATRWAEIEISSNLLKLAITVIEE